jgi:hypothetical protein
MPVRTVCASVSRSNAFQSVSAAEDDAVSGDVAADSSRKTMITFYPSCAATGWSKRTA